MLKNTCIILFLLFSFSCRKETYLPKESDAFLASLKFSEGLVLQEKFDKERFDYSLKVPSALTGFFVICVPDNPLSKCTVFIQGIQDIELPFPYIPVKPPLSSFTIKILVSSPSGDTQTYTIKVSVL